MIRLQVNVLQIKATDASSSVVPSTCCASDIQSRTSFFFLLFASAKKKKEVFHSFEQSRTSRGSHGKLVSPERPKRAATEAAAKAAAGTACVDLQIFHSRIVLEIRSQVRERHSVSNFANQCDSAWNVLYERAVF